MAYDNNDKKQEFAYSEKIRAGKNRTYFFDIKLTKNNDYYLAITESRRKLTDGSFERNKLFVYKEDFNKFTKGLVNAVDYVKTELLPNFDFDAFNHDNYNTTEQLESSTEVVPNTSIDNSTVTDEKW